MFIFFSLNPYVSKSTRLVYFLDVMNPFDPSAARSRWRSDFADYAIDMIVTLDSHDHFTPLSRKSSILQLYHIVALL